MKSKDKLAQHGEYAVSKVGQIITFSAKGPWNDETMRSGSRDVGSIIQSMDKSKPWAQISCLYGESLMPPTTFEMFIKQTAIRKDIGLSALAVVLKQIETPLMTREQLKKGYESTGIDYAFFESIGDALAWLRKLGFELDPSAIETFFDQHAFD